MTIQVGKVGMVPTSSIIVSDRTREIMGDLEGLELNMKESGLISPLAVRDNGDNTYRLLAGERRYTVLQRNNVEEIPVRIYDRDLTELEMKIIEKSENFYRKDMEYWEFDKLTLEIHQMQQTIHGAKAPGPGQQGWSIEDTGKTLGGISKAAISQSIKRAEAREAFPELFDNCKSASDASKVLKKVDEAVIKQVIAQKLEAEPSKGSAAQLANSFIIGNTFEGIKKLPNNIIHLVEIDPPYAIDLHSAKKSEGESKYIKDEYSEIPIDAYLNGHPDPTHPWRGLKTLFKECYRVMTEHSWLICWFAPEPWFDIVYQAIIEAGFSTTRMCGLWTKPYGQSKRPEMKLANCYEMFFYAWKGRPALNKARSNVFDHAPVPAQQKTHPTERPISLTTDIYDTFAFPGSRILIPFLGSGNGLISAYNLGMSGIGYELGRGNKDSFLIKVHNILK